MYTSSWYRQFLDEIPKEPYTLRKASVLWKRYRSQLTVDTHVFTISDTILEIDVLRVLPAVLGDYCCLKDDRRNG